MSNAIDLKYKPKSYFWAKDLGIQLTSDIKGAVRKGLAEELIDADKNKELDEFLNKAKLSEEQRKNFGAIHPMFMGGEYLDDKEEDEVEIARIVINSTTFDVICVYAKKLLDGIQYRVVDEYDGDTLNEDEQPITKEPMTLEELADYFLSTWDLMYVLEDNFVVYGDEPEMARWFVKEASSSFYSQFEELIRQKVDEWVIARTTD
jgi:6-pyruvoyl-tetrahydropterin synthase